MNDESIDRQEQATPTQGPGERLQAARIEQGIALKDLANKMHLSEYILECLEANHFEEITAPIFVKGYLRAYARIVGLDEREIIDLYVSGYMDGDPPITSTHAAEPLVHKSRGWGWMLLLIVAAAVAFWLYQRDLKKAETLSLDTFAEPGVTQISRNDEAMVTAESRLADDASQRLRQSLAVEPEETALPEETPAMSGSSDIMAIGDAKGQNELSQTGEEEPMPPSHQSEQPMSGAGRIAEPETAPAQPSSDASVPAPEPNLEVRTTADTWVDIRDATGRKRVYNLLRPGRHLQLDAEPPVRLFFGNGHGVELSWRGRSVDLTDKIRADNTVRITLE